MKDLEDLDNKPLYEISETEDEQKEILDEIKNYENS